MEQRQFKKGSIQIFFALQNHIIDQSNFTLSDFYGNLVPDTPIEPVDEVVADFNAIVGPVDGQRVFSTDTAVFAIYSGGQWLLRQAITDDIFLNIPPVYHPAPSVPSGFDSRSSRLVTYACGRLIAQRSTYSPPLRRRLR